MTPFESIFYMIWRGIAIGIMISAPMGPVGILCIQRTLYKGRKAGFYTGIGAAISDIIYCLLTGFGLSFIEDFINDNQNVIQLLGSIVLIAFSIYLFKKNPSSSMRKPLPQNVSARKNILGGFLFTFSNPLIIFLIIGLFARFNFTNPEISGYYYAIGYIFIVAGALGWWYGVTYAIDKVRSRFNMRSMKTLNVIIGIIILCFAAVGIITSIIGLTSADASARGILHQRRTLMADTIIGNSGPQRAGITLLDKTDSPSPFFQIDFKASNLSAAPMKKYPWKDLQGNSRSSHLPPWSISFVNENSDTLRFEIRIAEIPTSQIDTQSALVVSAIKSDATREGIVVNSVNVTSGINCSSDWNHFRIISSPEDGISLLGGSKSLRHLISIGSDDLRNFANGEGEESGANFLPAEIVIESAPGNSLVLRHIRFSPVFHPSTEYCHLSLSEIEERLRASADHAEGKWRILDSSMNEDLLRLGGDYILASVRRPDGAYELAYLSGGNVNGRQWRPGMLKGTLTPTGISTVYDLEWIDPMGAKLTYRLKAQFESQDLLTLQFPYHDSTLRLHRID